MACATWVTQVTLKGTEQAMHFDGKTTPSYRQETNTRSKIGPGPTKPCKLGAKGLLLRSYLPESISWIVMSHIFILDNTKH